MHPGEGLVLSAAAGCLFGVSDISIKFLTHAANDGVTHALISPWALAALVASVIAFYSSARSLQIGPALAVIAFTSVAANLIAITGQLWPVSSVEIQVSPFARSASPARHYGDVPQTKCTGRDRSPCRARGDSRTLT